MPKVEIDIVDLIRAIGPVAQATTSGTAFEIGKPYFIRTATHAQTGRVVSVTEHEIVLEDAAWIADTGRFANAIASAGFDEVEPFPPGSRVIVGRPALIDAVQIKSLPMAQK